jgi:zinc protease
VTNYVQGIFSAPPLTSPDYYAMRVATSILQSRVFEEVRELRNLSYAPDAFLWNRGANAGGIYVTADDANQAVRLMLEEIARLQRMTITPQALAGTTQHFLTMHYLRQQTSSAQAGELAQYELIGGGWRNAETFLDRLRAVTPQDVQRVANTYMRDLQFVVLGDPRSIDRSVFLGSGGR